MFIANTARAMPILIQAHSFALDDAVLAPSKSPFAHFDFTCIEKIIGTMPKGMQQQRKLKTAAVIDNARWFGKSWPGICGLPYVEVSDAA